MKTRILRVLLTLFAIVGIMCAGISSASAKTQSEIKAWLDNQNANSYVHGSGNYRGQCVPFVSDYLAEFWGISGVSASLAKDFPCPPGWTDINIQGNVNNYQMGDIIVEDWGDGIGHVAVYYGVEYGYHYVVDQNSKVDGNVRMYANKHIWWDPISSVKHCYRATEEIRGEAMPQGFDRALPDGDYIIAACADPRYILSVEVGGSNVQLSHVNSLDAISEGNIWTLTYNNSTKFYTIKQKGTTMALDVAGDGMEVKKNVQVFSSSNPSADPKTHNWAISTNGSLGYRIQARCSGYSLDMSTGLGDGVNVRQYTENDSNDERWIFIPYRPSQPISEGRYRIVSALNDSYSLNVEGDSGNIADGANVQLGLITEDSQNNCFELVPLSNGYYGIVHTVSGKALEVLEGSRANRANVWLNQNNNSDAQQWGITRNSHGYTVWAKCSGKVLDIVGNTAGDGVNVFQHFYNGGTVQSWLFNQAAYFVSFEPNGGAGEMRPVEVQKGAVFTLPACGFTAPEGKEFSHWDKGPAGAQITVNEDMTLVAQWKNQPSRTIILEASKTDLIVGESYTIHRYVEGFDYVIIHEKINDGEWTERRGNGSGGGIAGLVASKVMTTSEWIEGHYADEVICSDVLTIRITAPKGKLQPAVIENIPDTIVYGELFTPVIHAVENAENYIIGFETINLSGDDYEEEYFESVPEDFPDGIMTWTTNSAYFKKAQYRLVVTAYALGAETSVSEKVFSIIDPSSATHSGKCGDNLTWTLDQDGLLTITGTGPMYNYSNTNPAPWGKAINQVDIKNGATSIGNQAFEDCDNLLSVTIPSSVTSIEYFAFYNCSNLTSVSIPNSVTLIGEAAFAACNNLTNITIPDGVISIGFNAFQGCGLTTLVVPESVIVISKGAFSLCSNLTSVVIPNSITRIDDGTFGDCSSLTTITIPSSVTSIGNGAFEACNSLTNIVIPDSVTSLGDQVFAYCRNLTDVTLPKEIRAIGNATFHTCTSLTNVEIPNTVTSIGEGAFAYCDSLTTFTIPKGVTTIGFLGFHGCHGLTSITIPDSMGSIDQLAFENCNALKDVYFNGTYEQWKNIIIKNGNNPLLNAQLHCLDSIVSFGTLGDNLTWSLDTTGLLTISGTGPMYDFTESEQIGPITYNEAIKRIVIENGVTSIGGKAFYYCINMTDITIPASVAAIGEKALVGCRSLTNIHVDAENNDYCTVEGVLFNKSKTRIVRYPVMKSGAYSIPSYVMEIGNDAFSDCKLLSTIEIPASVIRIGDAAFNHCVALTSITIPSSVTMIGDYAFYSCEALNSVILPVGINRIGTYAFGACVSLTNLDIPEGVTSIEFGAFSESIRLRSITIPDSVTSIGDYAFYCCSSLTDIYYGGTSEQWKAISIHSEGNENLLNAIMHYESNGVLILPAALTMIGEEAFAGGTFTTVQLSENTSVIQSRAFADCKSLKNIVILNKNCVIADDAFSGSGFLVIYAKEGSTAVKYAADHGYGIRIIKDGLSN